MEEQEKNNDQDFQEDVPYVPLVSRKGIGPNDPCPCNSGKKYKDCHEKSDMMLLPSELRTLLRGLVSIVRGVTIPQASFDEAEDNEISITFNENKQAWDICPVKKEGPIIVLPSKELVSTKRKLIKLN